MIGLGVHRKLGPPAQVAVRRFREWLRRDFFFTSRGFLFREGWSIPFGDVAYGRGRTVLIGDAAGFCEPLTGEGILFGIQSAAVAVAAITEHDPERGLAEVYSESALPIGRKMEEITANIRSLRDHEREERVRVKGERLSHFFQVTALA